MKGFLRDLAIAFCLAGLAFGAIAAPYATILILGGLVVLWFGWRYALPEWRDRQYWRDLDH